MVVPQLPPYLWSKQTAHLSNVRKVELFEMYVRITVITFWKYTVSNTFGSMNQVEHHWDSSYEIRLAQNTENDHSLFCEGIDNNNLFIDKSPHEHEEQSSCKRECANVFDVDD